MVVILFDGSFRQESNKAATKMWYLILVFQYRAGDMKIGFYDRPSFKEMRYPVTFY